MANSNEITFEIVEQIGVISESKTGWRKEINRVSWNGATPKYDVREWDSTHTRMSRGMTLTDDEMVKLVSLVRSSINRPF